jgi:TRAP-type mannitol/chloroaromatic compound transport system substrate-binding protein
VRPARALAEVLRRPRPAEESAKDPDFKRTHDSLAAFRKQYAIWKEHGYLK